MPIKTVREMDTRERRQYSLNTRVFNATRINCIILGAVALLVGLNLYIIR